MSRRSGIRFADKDMCQYENQLFSTDDPAPGSVPTNQGFVINFKAAIQSDEAKGFKDTLAGTDPTEIMAMYAPEMLPIMSGLARGFAVCDQWFASAPTQTIPNRTFAGGGDLAGTSRQSRQGLYLPEHFWTARRQEYRLGDLWL
jgi:phospholipase C